MSAQDFYILVVDDEESIRTILYETLSSEGYNVTTAESGDEALQIMENDFLPHILLTDIRMDGLNGIELSVKAREISEEIEIIIMTSHASLKTATEAIKIGVYDYLIKPFENLSEIKTVILRVVNKIYARLEREYLVEQLKDKNTELTTANNKISKVNQDIASIYNLSRKLASLLEPQDVVDIFLQEVAELIDGNVISVFFKYYAKRSALAIKGLSSGKLSTIKDKKDFINIGVNIAKSPDTDLLEVFRRMDKHPSIKTLINKLFKSSEYIIYPILFGNNPVAIVAIINEKEKIQANKDLIQQFVSQFVTNYDKALLHQKIKELVIKDGLTGLYNRRFFQERIVLEAKRAKRLLHPLSLIFFDIDHFKNYNDTNGHQAGDDLLIQMGALMNKSVRETDIACRYGGEEFCIILPHTDQEGAKIKAEKLRKLVEETEFFNQEAQPNGNLTISIGVSEIPSHTDTAESLIKLADDALYKSKDSGRNTVNIAVSKAGYQAPYIAKHVSTGPRKR